jgi:hypothetical protein
MLEEIQTQLRMKSLRKSGKTERFVTIKRNKFHLYLGCITWLLFRNVQHVTKEMSGKNIYAVDLHIALINQFYAYVNHVSEEVLHS